MARGSRRVRSSSPQVHAMPLCPFVLCWTRGHDQRPAPRHGHNCRPPRLVVSGIGLDCHPLPIQPIALRFEYGRAEGSTGAPWEELSPGIVIKRYSGRLWVSASSCVSRPPAPPSYKRGCPQGPTCSPPPPTPPTKDVLEDRALAVACLYVFCWGPLAEVGGRFESRHPPPPPSFPQTPPQVFEHVFLQIEIVGKSAGTEGAEFFLAS